MFTLLTNLLLASVALAAPSTGLEGLLAHRSENTVESRASTGHLAGAHLTENSATFTTVTSTFIVPSPADGAADGAAYFSAAIDGFSCNVVLQSGIGLKVTNGVSSYNAFARWYPAIGTAFSGIDIAPGDHIRATVTAESTTNGIATIDNLTTNQSASQELSSTDALCEQNAEWVVQDWDPLNPNAPVAPLVNFGSVTFDDATASDASGNSYPLSDAMITEIEQSGKVLTSVSIGDSSVTVSYIGSS